MGKIMRVTSLMVACLLSGLLGNSLASNCPGSWAGNSQCHTCQEIGSIPGAFGQPSCVQLTGSDRQCDPATATGYDCCHGGPPLQNGTCTGVFNPGGNKCDWLGIKCTHHDP